MGEMSRGHTLLAVSQAPSLREINPRKQSHRSGPRLAAVSMIKG